MDNPIQVDLGRIAQDLQIRRVQVESVVQLLDEGNTVPFITRYRKERTGNLNEVVIREIQVRVQRLRELAERKETILKAIEAQGKMTPDLSAAIRAADNPKRLEDLYLPFKPKKRTKASDARERGLEPLAFRIWTRDEALLDLNAAALEFINAEKGVESVEKVLEGVGHILAEAISEMAMVRDAVRKVVWKTGKIVTAKAEIPEGQGLEYRDYFEYSEPVAQIPPHRVLAINRGDKEGPLKVKLDVSRPEVESVLFSQLPLEGHPHADLFRAAAIDALDRLILPSMEREVRRDLTEAAEKHAVEVFARNLGSLLLQPPIPKQVVLAIDPGFRTGCKVAVLDPGGNLLDQIVVFPHPPQNRRSEAKVALKDLVGKYKVGVVAIGNGTACRETEELIAEIIAEGTRFSQGDSALPPAGADAPSDAAATPSPEAEGAGDTSATPATATHEGDPAQAVIPAEPVAHTLGDSGSDGDHPALSGGDHPVPSEAGEPAPTPSPQAESNSEEDVLGNGSGGDSHPKDESHSSSPVEATIEALPPISGGAPDSDDSSEGGTAPSPAPDAPPPPETIATAVLEDTAQGFINEGSEPSATAEHAPTADHLPVSTEGHSGPSVDEPTAGPVESAVSEPEPMASSSQAASPVATGDHLPSPTQDSPASPPETEISVTPTAETATVEAAQPGASEPDSTAAVAAPVEGGTPSGAAPVSAPATPGGRPPRPGRSGGQGKQESRNRAPRPKQPHAPPPPQTPPQPHPADTQLAQLAYVIVNEAGASVYSTSQAGREELPEFDPTLRSGISIGRRLQDPLAELVKIEPQNIGVGLYQHDVNPKQLKEMLESVISSCVNFVGVDLNTASVPLLRHVSGLNQLTARRIVEYRKERGPFARRAQLMEVEGVGPATFTQAAGFLKLLDGGDPLDRTWVHPESYPAAVKLLEKFGVMPDVVLDKVRLPDLRAQLAQADVPSLAAELEIGEFTLRDIIEALGRPERDPRDDLPKPIFKKGVLKLEDLTAGMELKGTVLNVVDFGAFVDIGLKDSGLVHISQLANRYVKSPHDVVSVSDVVTVWVMGVDQERKRVSLTMVKPGTERHRGAPGGGRRGGEAPDPNRQREGRGGPPGQGRRGAPAGPRPPRPPSSALTSPPVGAPSVAVLAETPSRRPDRDHGRDRGPAGAGPRPNDASSAGPPPPRYGQGPGQGGPGRPSGPRGHYSGPGQGGGRPPRSQDRDRDRDRGAPPQRPPSRPSRPSAPPPPLSKDALAGNVPLRTFGQLKQLWEARVDDLPEPPVDPRQAAGDRPATAQDQPRHQTESPPPPHADSEKPSNPE